jgi:hypothetical protein
MIKIIARFVFVLALVATSTYINAQEGINTNFLYKADSTSSDTLGQVVYYQSEAIASILKKNIIVNETKKSFRGYRVQIFSVSGVNSKDKANKEKAELLLDYPDIHVYVVYNAPYFKVRIGDFITKLEALYFMQSILKDYPFAFIVEDDINYPYIEEPTIDLNE